MGFAESTLSGTGDRWVSLTLYPSYGSVEKKLGWVESAKPIESATIALLAIVFVSGL
jgi:hypothetical protein